MQKILNLKVWLSPDEILLTRCLTRALRFHKTKPKWGDKGAAY